MTLLWPSCGVHTGIRCTVRVQCTSKSFLAAWSRSPKTRHDQRSISGCPRVRKALVDHGLSLCAVFQFRSPTKGARAGCSGSGCPCKPARARPADRRLKQLPGTVRTYRSGRWLTRRGPGLRFFTGKQCTDALF